MSLDPRLADVTLLVLAAKRRLARRPAAWEHTRGISALLEAAKMLPQRDPWALPDLDEEPTGLAALLKEARLRAQQETIMSTQNHSHT